MKAKKLEKKTVFIFKKNKSESDANYIIVPSTLPDCPRPTTTVSDI